MTVISGGQTGVDRAALDVAIELGLPTGGWVPQGRLAEDGSIPLRYTGLEETHSADPAERTVRNVRDSDATLIISRGPLAGGSLLTLETAAHLGRPLLHLDLSECSQDEAVGRARRWLTSFDPGRLNVAGPRASEDPAVGQQAAEVLRDVLRDR